MIIFTFFNFHYFSRKRSDAERLRPADRSEHQGAQEAQDAQDLLLLLQGEEDADRLHRDLPDRRAGVHFHLAEKSR